MRDWEAKILIDTGLLLLLLMALLAAFYLGNMNCMRVP